MNILIYTNILTPYRKYFYDILYKNCLEQNDCFKVFVMAETEPNRKWIYDDFKSEYTELLECRTIIRKEIYIHKNPNLKEKLKEFSPDIVICGGSYLCPGISTICRLKKKMGFKVIFWSESHLNEERKYNFFKLAIREIIRKNIYKRFDGFLYAGKLSKEFILKYNQNGKMFFLPNLIDETKYRQATLFSVSKKQILMSCFLACVSSFSTN